MSEPVTKKQCVKEVTRYFDNVWDYFSKSDKDKSKAICDVCSKTIARNNGSTSGMRRHLELIHKIYPKDHTTIAEPSTSTSKSLKQESLKTFVKKPTLESDISEMVFENLTLSETDFKKKSFLFRSVTTTYRQVEW